MYCAVYFEIDNTFDIKYYTNAKCGDEVKICGYVGIIVGIAGENKFELLVFYILYNLTIS